MSKSQVNILKALAMVAVIVIHTNAAYIWLNFSKNLVVLDQLVRFSVPLFVALSGYGLAKSYGIRVLNLRGFFKHRVVKLLPWYLVWSTIIFFTYPHYGPFWKAIVFGRADYHLYFVPMILQLYILFPLLFLAIRRWPRVTVLAAFIWQIWWFYIIGTKTEYAANTNAVWTDQQQYVVFISWVFYFVLGIYLAVVNWSEEKLKILKWGAVGLGLTGIVWAVVNTFGLSGAGIDIIVATRFTRIPVLVFCTGLIAALAFWKWKLPNFWENLLAKMGEISYLTFLLHTTVLRFFADILGWHKFLPEPIFLIIIVMLSFFFGWIYTKAVSVATARIMAPGRGGR